MITVKKVLSAQEGACNGCRVRAVEVYLVDMKVSSFRVCETCRQQLIESLSTAV